MSLENKKLVPKAGPFVSLVPDFVVEFDVGSDSKLETEALLR